MAVMDKIKDFIKPPAPKKKINKDKPNVQLPSGRLYDYSTKEARESNIPFLYYYAKTQRDPQVQKWQLYDDYYNGKHRCQDEIRQSCMDSNIPYIPAVIQDPYIQVETLIIPDVPDFEFNGRDDDLDSAKAKQRQYVVQYVLDDNKVNELNTDNERQLNKLGNAFWKVAFDYNLKDGNQQGKIVIGNPDCASIFPDPAAYSLEDCEFIDVVWREHKLKVARRFAGDFERLGIDINQIGIDGNYADTEIYNSQTYDPANDTVQIIEHWFRQPTAGSDTYEYDVDGKTITENVEWESGDIACSIIIGDTEIRYIPLYWRKTHKQNKMYPIVKYCKIPVAKSFWDRSELESIIELVDAADRDMAMMILNDNFNANDIILEEEGALSDDSDNSNMPGARWKVRQGKIGGVQRLGGLGNLNGGLKDTIKFLRDHIKETAGNWDVNQGGAPPSNIKTLGGLVELKAQGEARQNLKKADRKAGFELLYELVDWTALEFYDDDRIIYIGAEGDVTDQMQIKANGLMSQEEQIIYAEQQQEFQQQGMQAAPPPNMDRKKGPVIFKYNSDNLKNENGYFPRVDANVNVGDGVVNSKSFTLSAMETITKMPITVSNYKVICAMIDEMNIPTRKEIKQYLESYFGNLQMGVPTTKLDFKDLPPEGKVQFLQKIGMQIQTPPPADDKNVPWSILAQNQPNVNGNVPLESQVQNGQQGDSQSQGITPQQQQMLNDLVNNAHVHLTPLEFQHLTEHPEILQQIVQEYGGNNNGQ